MAWTEITRRQYARRTARYASDMTDREWGLVEPFLPVPRRLGRPRTTDLREVVNALLYIATTGCQWRMLPKDFPPCSTVQRYFYEWRALGLWTRINHHLVMPRRWVVERTFAWLGRCRRLAKDVEKSIASSEAWIMIAHIRLITRWLARYRYH